MSKPKKLTNEDLEAILEDCDEDGFPVIRGSEVMALIDEVRSARATKGRSWPGWIAVMDERGEKPEKILPDHDSTMVPMARKCIPGRFVETPVGNTT